MLPVRAATVIQLVPTGNARVIEQFHEEEYLPRPFEKTIVPRSPTIPTSTIVSAAFHLPLGAYPTDQACFMAQEACMWTARLFQQETR
jgi:hypothetical protein